MSCSASLRAVTVVKGDDLPAIRLQVIDRNTGLPVNLNGAGITATARLRKQGTATTLLANSLTKIDNGVYGWLKFAWTAGQTDNLALGMHELQVEVTFAGLVHTMRTLAKINVIEKFTAPA